MIGALVAMAVAGEANPALSSDLGSYIEAAYTPTLYWADSGLSAVYDGYRMPAGNGYGRQGIAPRGFVGDYYDRVHVIPGRIDLGNLASAQVREVVIWNASLSVVHTVESTALADGDGIVATAPAVLPLDLQPMQERTWTLTVSDDGAPSIAATLTFTLTGLDDITVTIVGVRLNAWPVPADWSQPVNESLAWLTDLQRSLSGATARLPCRVVPRRSFEFGLVEGQTERRIVENLVYDWSARLWALPIWPDVTLLSAPVGAGADHVPVVTAGLDFAEGSLAMLWSSVRRFELLEIEAVDAGQIAFSRPVTRDWPAGTRLYPCRTARLSEAPTLRRKNDQVIVGRVRFDIDEPCDWPAIAPASSYLGFPVLETRSDESEDPSVATPRDLVTIDGDVGLYAVDDYSGLVYGRQSHAWVLDGRAERAAHRSLLYWLQGRAQALWVPTWADDVALLSPLAADDRVLIVAWAGIARTLRQQPGRRHLRIELRDGTVLYREVLSSAELDEDREQLLVDADLGRAVAPADVRLLCWMALCLQDADRVEIAHQADSEGVALCRTAFTATPGDEP